jgi:hypothetical protein
MVGRLSEDLFLAEAEAAADIATEFALELELFMLLYCL